MVQLTWGQIGSQAHFSKDVKDPKCEHYTLLSKGRGKDRGLSPTCTSHWKGRSEIQLEKQAETWGSHLPVTALG